MIWRGVLAVIVGIVAVVWPHITVYALVLLFAVFAFGDAIGEFAHAFASERAGSVAGHLLLGLLDVAAGVVAIAWPGITAYALTIVVAIWAVIFGVVEFAAAFTAPAAAGTRAALGLTGVVSVIFGFAVFANLDAGVLSLALLFGLFSLVYGMYLLVMGIQLRRGVPARAGRARA
jgi:uncharacterized membrane protein HdeD (DUF308 family)